MYPSKEFLTHTSTNKHSKSMFSFDFERCNDKHVSCMCSKCYNVAGHLKYSYTNAYTLSSDDLSDSVILSNIIVNIPFLETFPIFCKECDKITVHFTVDYGLEQIIQLLNRSGLTTTYSCEGHSIEDPLAYIAFQDNVQKYFDMSNKLLEKWAFDKHDPVGSYYSSCIRLKSNVTLDYIYSNKYLNDLYKYIKKYIAIKDKKERKVKNKKC